MTDDPDHAWVDPRPEDPYCAVCDRHRDEHAPLARMCVRGCVRAFHNHAGPCLSPAGTPIEEPT